MFSIQPLLTTLPSQYWIYTHSVATTSSCTYLCLQLENVYGFKTVPTYPPTTLLPLLLHRCLAGAQSIHSLGAVQQYRFSCAPASTRANVSNAFLWTTILRIILGTIIIIIIKIIIVRRNRHSSLIISAERVYITLDYTRAVCFPVLLLSLVLTVFFVDNNNNLQSIIFPVICGGLQTTAVGG